jgi:hypothetical protein
MKPAFTVAIATRFFASLLFLTIASVSFAQEAKGPDLVIADFEEQSYGDWIFEGAGESELWHNGPRRDSRW